MLLKIRDMEVSYGGTPKWMVYFPLCRNGWWELGVPPWQSADTSKNEQSSKPDMWITMDTWKNHRGFCYSLGILRVSSLGSQGPQKMGQETNQGFLPSGQRLQKTNWKDPPCWENSLFLWPCSIAMLNYQRVNGCLSQNVWKFYRFWTHLQMFPDWVDSPCLLSCGWRSGWPLSYNLGYLYISL